MKHTLALLTLLTALGANAQVWTNLSPSQQATFIRVYNRYAFAVTNLTSFRYVTNALPSAWSTNATTGEVTVTATTNKVTEVNPPLASRQLYYLHWYNQADASEKVVRTRDAILWQKLMQSNAEAAEAIAADRENK